ncbi:MAG: retropepsin-like aspartic protease [Candidatus Bathyarchaeia archaeon]
MFKLHKWRIKQVNSGDYISLQAKVSNPLQAKPKVNAEFLVDTGATGCAISQKLAEKLGLESVGSVDAVLADGSIQKAKAAYIIIEIDGKHVYAFTIYGEGFTEILGLDVMRALGFHIDVPEKKVLMPHKNIRVKNIRLSTNIKPLYYQLTMKW